MTTSATFRARCLAAAAASLLAAPLFAGAAGSADANAKYQKERAACLNGTSQQDRATCLREAGAALDEARHHRLDNGETMRQRDANATDRCAAVKPEDRSDCEKMAHGEGVVSGSVEGGGVIKEMVTRTVEPTTVMVPPAAPAPEPQR